MEQAVRKFVYTFLFPLTTVFNDPVDLGRVDAHWKSPTNVQENKVLNNVCIFGVQRIFFLRFSNQKIISD